MLEAALQKACVDLLGIYEQQGKLTYFHVPNGIFLRGTKAQRAMEMEKMKRMGLRPGAPDLTVIFADGRTAWVELKSATGSLEPEQKAWRDRLQALGHEWHLFRDHLAMSIWLNSRLA